MKLRNYSSVLLSTAALLALSWACKETRAPAAPPPKPAETAKNHEDAKSPASTTPAPPTADSGSAQAQTPTAGCTPAKEECNANKKADANQPAQDAENQNKPEPEPEPPLDQQPQPTDAACTDLPKATVLELITCLEKERLAIAAWIGSQGQLRGKVAEDLSELKNTIAELSRDSAEITVSELGRASYCADLSFVRVDLSILNRSAQAAGLDLKQLMEVEERDFLALLPELQKRGSCQAF